MSGIVGRFAPSPTGRLHLGNIASMLVAWLAARVLGGRVLLRIEDIDLPRAVPDADKWIMDDLHWLGLDWDGEPVWQSRRLDLYEQELHKIAVLRLLGPDGEPSDERAVFPCFCSRKDLREASAPQGSDGFVIYPGTCRHFASDPAMTGSALFDDRSAVSGLEGVDSAESDAPGGWRLWGDRRTRACSHVVTACVWRCRRAPVRRSACRACRRALRAAVMGSSTRHRRRGGAPPPTVCSPTSSWW